MLTVVASLAFLKSTCQQCLYYRNSGNWLHISVPNLATMPYAQPLVKFKNITVQNVLMENGLLLPDVILGPDVHEHPDVFTDFNFGSVPFRIRKTP